MRKLIILAAIAASLSVAACNTVEGAGKDVSSAGNAVSDTAKDARELVSRSLGRGTAACPGSPAGGFLCLE